MYKCSKCGLGVIVYDGSGKVLETPIKACNCKAPITVDLKGSMKGTGGVKL